VKPGPTRLIRPSLQHCAVARVLILVHRDGSLHEATYFLRAIAEVWRERGHEVIEQRSPGAHVPADIAFLHADVTRVPEDHAAFVRRYPRAVNAGTVDISKRAISRSLVRRGDAYNGPVIVKTDANCGGMKDGVLLKRSPFRRTVRAVRNRLPWPLRARLATDDYRVFQSARDAPWPVWFNPDLVVERFLPEMRGDLYSLRTWVFLGDAETNSICYSRSPIVKSHTIIGREAVPDVPGELRAMRRELGFDFGKFDYAIVDGRVVLYDANRTPTLGDFPPEQYLPRVRLLADGLDSLLR